MCVGISIPQIINLVPINFHQSLHPKSQSLHPKSFPNEFFFHGLIILQDIYKGTTVKPLLMDTPCSKPLCVADITPGPDSSPIENNSVVETSLLRTTDTPCSPNAFATIEINLS